MLSAATQAKADGFTIRYNGTLVSITPASGTYSLPLGLALDLSGNLYIADTGNNRILKASAGSTTAELFTITIGGTAATFNTPEQLAVDSAGNLYIADTDNNRIVKSDPSGNGAVLSTGSLTLNGPIGVAVDASGDVFISDTGNQRIVEIPSGGSATVLATASGISLTTLTSPQGLATDTYGNLYIVDLFESDSSNNRVVEVSTSLVGSTIATGGTLDYPLAVTVGNNGIIYVTDYLEHRIAIHDPQGDNYDLFNDEINSELGHPAAIATDSQGAFYLTDFVANTVQLFHQGSADFGHETLGSSGTPETLNFDVDGDTTITGVAVYTAGIQNLDYTIAANSGTPCTTGSTGIECTVNVQFTPAATGLRRGALVLSYFNTAHGSGNFTVPLFGIGDGPVAVLSPGIASQVSTGSLSFPSAFQPFQTAYDGVGDIYATDSANNRVLKIPAGGGQTTVVSIPALPSPATLNGPAGLAIDGAGNLFIADSGNNRIVEVTPYGSALVVPACVVETVSPCTSYSFNDPQSLFIDGSGNLIVDDTGNNKIVELTVAYSATQDNTLDTANAFVLATGSFSLGSNSTSAVVDAAEGLYTSDDTNNRIIHVDRFGSASLVNFSSLSTALTTPHSVALDPMGNLYVMDAGGSSGAQRVVQQFTIGANSTLSFSGASFGSAPNEIAVDNYGNVLVADASSNHLIQVNVGESAQAFPDTKKDSASTAQTTTVTNLGDQPLVFSANPAYTANFSQNTGDSNLCNSDTSLTVGITCDVSIIFSPQSIGSLSANIAVTDDTQNIVGSTQEIAVNGTGSTAGDTTSAMLSFSPTSPVYGQSVTITATVSDTSNVAAVPTGSVVFTDALTSSITQVSLNSFGVATLTASQIVGSHSITADYGGVTGTFLGSSDTETLIVGKASTSTAVTLSGNTLTATVMAIAPGAGTPTGTVQFKSGGTVIGNGTLNGGTATLPLTATAPDSFTAIYSGDANFVASTSQAVVTYPPATSTLMLTSSPNPAQLGQPVTFTAFIAAQGGPPSATLTGSVQFSDGTKVLGSSSVSNGQATYTTTALSGGVHIITATYSGNATFPSASASIDLTVSAPLIMNVTAAPSAPVYGQSVTLTATVGATTVPAGFSAPSGQVTFFLEGSTPFSPSTRLGTVALTSGGATLSLSTLPAGPAYIQAQYSGDSTWPAASHQIALIVSPAATTTFVSVTITSGQLVLTGTVAPQPPGAGTPTGSVQFVDTSNHNAVVASAALSGGTATAQVATSAVEDRPIAAAYSGDGNFSPSTSAPLPAIANSAANVSATVAPDEIASLFGVPGLNGTITATLPLGTSLGGTSVNITGSTGTTRPALLYGVYGSAGQINLVIPSDTAAGPAVASITLPGGTVVTTALSVVTIAPAVYTANSMGQGIYAGQVTYVQAGGTQTIVPSATYNPASNTFTPNPINLGTPGDQVFLVLYGTGLRHGTSVTVTVNGTPVPVAFFGAQPVNPGLDQINLGPLPTSLAGSGQVNVVVTVDGQAANTVTATIL